MAKKTTRKKNEKRRQPIERQRRGPQGARPAVTYTNGVRPMSGTHHLMDQMGAHPGAQSHASKRLCELYLDPMSKGPPVVQDPKTELYFNGSTLANIKTSPLCSAGEFVQRRTTVTAVVGSQTAVNPFGFMFVRGDWSGPIGSNNVAYTNETFNAANFTTMVGTTQIQRSPTGRSPGGKHRVFPISTMLKVIANVAPANGRDGEIIAYSGNADIAGQAPDTFRETPGTKVYPAGIFDGDDQVIVRCRPAHSVISVSNGTSTNLALAGEFNSDIAGFIFTGSTGHAYTVEITTAYFVFGYFIPRTIVPMTSTAAFDCLLQCVAAMEATQVGNLSGHNSRAATTLYKHAESHTLINTIAPLISASWPLLKKLAVSKAPELLASIF